MNTDVAFPKASEDSKEHAASSDHCRDHSLEFKLLKRPWLWEAVSFHPSSSQRQGQAQNLNKQCSEKRHQPVVFGENLIGLPTHHQNWPRVAPTWARQVMGARLL